MVAASLTYLGSLLWVLLPHKPVMTNSFMVPTAQAGTFFVWAWLYLTMLEPSFIIANLFLPAPQ
jgi:hypothetical protein